ncbi:hypothetical protein FKW77_010212 [Venturia effusa]|uniref:Opi1-domain-containing protein n=1 Tax=Venturia effusa TaxID=50376 RepID=A0A517L0C9_9PEZI|nr:hypothetical protein FKW77_010212 [Venturia effusa]
MDLQRERPPSYASDERLNLPSVPTHGLPSPPTNSSALHLPALQSLGLPNSQPTFSHPQSQPSAESCGEKWQHGTLSVSAFPSVPSGALRASVELPLASPTTEVGSDEHGNRAQSVMSMDDPDTRAAAEALSGLRNPEYIRSPSTRSTTVSMPQQNLTAFTMTRDDGEVEPLLSLVTSNHPWIGGTINGSLSAYNTTKNYSPAFVRSSAEFVERNIGSPIASTFASVSHHTGVEGGIRRYLGDRRPSMDDREASRKRRRLRESSPETDIEKGLASPTLPSTYRSRAGSQVSFAESLASLPPYDDHRSPHYEESPTPTAVTAMRERPEPRPWRMQLVVTTSGLAAALSEGSLSKLRTCLKMLHGATNRLRIINAAIKQLIRDYEQSNQHQATDNKLTPEQEDASRRLAERMHAFHHEIMSCIQAIKNSISHYTGGALPENAGALVRRQLMSIPHRWGNAEREAAEQDKTSTPEGVRKGNRLSAFATQGLDMISEVTAIVSATIENAEGWLDRYGKKREQAKLRESEAAQQNQNQDVKMESVEPATSGPATEKR